MNKSSGFKSLLIYLLISACIVGGLIFLLSSLGNGDDEKDYSEIMSYFDDLRVSEFDLDLGSGELTYKLDGEDKEYEYTVPNVSLFVNEVLGSDAENYRKQYNAKNPDNPLVCNLEPIKDNSLLISLLPTLILLGVMIAFFVITMKSAGGGGKLNSFSKTNAKMNLDPNKKVLISVCL